jgi:hypothetical protein
MKVRKIIISAIALSVITSASAIELHGARIIDHKEWITGDKIVSGHFEDVPFHKATGGAYVDARVDNAEGFTKSNTYIYGSHSFQIVNHSKTKEMYLYEYKLCADNTSCLYRSDHLEIDPSGSASNSANSTVVTYFDAAGTYHSFSSTRVSGESSGVRTANGTISIRKLG